MKLFPFLCLVQCSISFGFITKQGGRVPLRTDGEKAQMIASLAIRTIGHGARLLEIKNAWRQTVAGQKYIEDIEIRFPIYEVKLCHVELVQQLWVPRSSLSVSCVPKRRKESNFMIALFQ